MKNRTWNLKVFIWDNDPLQYHYKIGTYKVNGCIMPYEMYDDIQPISREHDVFFAFSDILDCFIDALLYGNGQAVSTDCSMFLQMEAIDGD